MMDWQPYLGIIADFVGVLGAVFALGAWIQTRLLGAELRHEEERTNQKVKLVLQHADRTVELPIEIRRAELTRAEVLGLLGMLPMQESGKRFTLRHLGKPKFLQQISEIRQSTGNAILTIPCTLDEIDQFDMSKLNS